MASSINSCSRPLSRGVRGQVEETIIANVQQDQIESHKHNQAFLKGLITVGTVFFGGAVLATTAKAEDVTSLAPTVSETKGNLGRSG